MATGEALYRRTGPVGGELEHGELACEAFEPVASLPVKRTAFDALALPEGVVEVLDGQGGRLLFRVGVALGDFAQGDLDGPAVGDDVVDDDGEDVIVLCQTVDVGTKQRAGFEVEGFETEGGEGVGQFGFPQGG